MANGKRLISRNRLPQHMLTSWLLTVSLNTWWSFACFLCIFRARGLYTGFISAESEEDMTRGECWSHFQWVSMLTFLLSGLKAKLYIWTSFSGCVPEMDPYGLKKAIRHSNYSKRQLPNKRVYWPLLWNARVVDNFVYFVCIVYVGPHHWNGRKTRHSMNG